MSGGRILVSGFLEILLSNNKGSSQADGILGINLYRQLDVLGVSTYYIRVVSFSRMLFYIENTV